MNQPAAKGWCPGALRPMMSGDGLLVRVRPRLGRLAADQVDALCKAADAHGSGLMDLTNRGNIQIRGVAPDSYDQLLACLAGAGLVDFSFVHESRDNIIVAPLWQHGDDTWRIATELGGRLHELPELPEKFGFALDAGGAPVLSTASADIRVEKGVSSSLIVRADGVARGERTTREDAVNRIIDLCHWFVETGGAASKRMASHTAQLSLSGRSGHEPPLETGPALLPGPSPIGPVYGVPFGTMPATILAKLVRASAAVALRTTPWRSFILEGGQPTASDAFSSDPSDPMQQVAACPGAPFCSSSTVDTRALARELSGVVKGSFHVSGCTKGCARPPPAPITVVGRDGRFDIVRNGCAWDAAETTGLDATEVVSQLGAS